ncbi:hypothetical protein L1987_10283 [Smallanthus sonchifolius]|uniref:Uncharacterized protein n=1 Tax=Smallanthus sonchifolius TaxID=185202 RepID=A0ACB9JRN4_9ASTR|nr:hypothetical protein L1987_10283 [Smallanthus sonchifolius]
MISFLLSTSSVVLENSNYPQNVAREGNGGESSDVVDLEPILLKFMCFRISGYTESLDDTCDIVVPQDDYGLYARKELHCLDMDTTSANAVGDKGNAFMHAFKVIIVTSLLKNSKGNTNYILGRIDQSMDGLVSRKAGDWLQGEDKSTRYHTRWVEC